MRKQLALALFFSFILLNFQVSGETYTLSSTGTPTHDYGTLTFTYSIDIPDPFYTDVHYQNGIVYDLNLVESRTGSSWIVSGYTFAGGIYDVNTNYFSADALNSTTLLSESDLTLHSGGGGSGSADFMLTSGKAGLTPGQSSNLYLAGTLFIRVCQDSSCEVFDDLFVDSSIQIVVENPAEPVTITETTTETTTEVFTSNKTIEVPTTITHNETITSTTNVTINEITQKIRYNNTVTTTVTESLNSSLPILILPGLISFLVVILLIKGSKRNR